MSELLDMMRRVVREELALRRGPQLAVVTALETHQSEDDTINYEADVRLKHDGLDIRRIPIAVSHVGFVAPPRVGDLVLLEFLDGDIQQPFISGRFYHDEDRPPLYQEDEVLFEHRVADGSINQLRFAQDGSIFLQRDISNAEDNSEFLAGIRIDPEGLIELKTSDDIVLTLDQSNGNVSLLCQDKPVEITCSELTLNGDATITGNLTVDGDGTISGNGSISSVSISGTTITGG